MKTKTTTTVSLLAALCMATFGIFSTASAEHHESTTGGTTHTVAAQGVKFSPMFLYIEPGDTVTWTNMIGHNIETIDIMVPEGQEKVLTEMGQLPAIKFDTVGIVVYKCTPHWGARMGGVIVVGKPDDPNAIIDAYTAAIETDPSSKPAKGLLKKLRVDMESKGLL
ncbi:MAG: plastocyanin/azurin family copper-binding protein [Pseudomonadota bacterium]